MLGDLALLPAALMVWRLACRSNMHDQRDGGGTSDASIKPADKAWTDVIVDAAEVRVETRVLRDAELNSDRTLSCVNTYARRRPRATPMREVQARSSPLWNLTDCSLVPVGEIQTKDRIRDAFRLQTNLEHHNQSGWRHDRVDCNIRRDVDEGLTPVAYEHMLICNMPRQPCSAPNSTLDGSSDLCDARVIHVARVRQARQQDLPSRRLEALSRIFKALGDPSRLRIVLALSQGEMCVCDLAAYLRISESAVSHQLRKLRDLALVRSRRHGQVLYYSLDDAHVANLVAQAVDHVQHEWMK